VNQGRVTFNWMLNAQNACPSWLQPDKTAFFGTEMVAVRVYCRGGCGPVYNLLAKTVAQKEIASLLTESLPAR
jgi:hypothetical protein